MIELRARMAGILSYEPKYDDDEDEDEIINELNLDELDGGLTLNGE